MSFGPLHSVEGGTDTPPLEQEKTVMSERSSQRLGLRDLVSLVSDLVGAPLGWLLKNSRTPRGTIRTRTDRPHSPRY